LTQHTPWIKAKLINQKQKDTKNKQNRYGQT